MSVKVRTSSLKFAAAEEAEVPRLGRSSSSPAAYAQDRHAKAKAGASTLKWDSCAAVESGAPGELLIVFDFDCTLAAMHMHSALRGEAGKAALQKDAAAFYLEVFGGSERLEKLRSFLTGLRGAGATLYVLSNGFESDIDPALDDMDLHDLFDRVIGCDGINAVACDDKVGMMTQFAVELSGRYPAGVSQILFVDDNRGNYPAEGDVQLGDSWRLSASGGTSQLSVPKVSLVAWPAGEKENGRGLDAAAMDAILARVLKGA